MITWHFDHLRLRFVYAPAASFAEKGGSMALTLTLVVTVAAVLLALAVVVVLSFGA